MPPDPGVAGSATRRWSVLTVWVTVPYRISEKRITAVSVDTLSVEPGIARAADTAEMAGRNSGAPSALNRYGGLKTWPSKWLVAQPPHRPPPPRNTVASGSRRPTEW